MLDNALANRLLDPRRWPASRRPCLMAVLRMAGLRPTRQRVALAELLFAGKHRHVSAEELHAEAEKSGAKVSLATIYNTLHQFREAGLLREVTVRRVALLFRHRHLGSLPFHIEDERRIVDIPADSVKVSSLPEPPPGMSITHVDVVVRVRKDPV